MNYYPNWKINGLIKSTGENYGMTFNISKLNKFEDIYELKYDNKLETLGIILSAIAFGILFVGWFVCKFL